MFLYTTVGFLYIMLHTPYMKVFSIISSRMLQHHNIVIKILATIPSLIQTPDVPSLQTCQEKDYMSNPLPYLSY